MNRRLAAAILLSFGWSAAWAFGQETSTRVVSPVSPTRPLGPGDQVTYRVLEDRDPPVQLLVSDTGELEIPYLGRVRVAGKTTSDAAAGIKELLEKDYYHTATVQLAIDQVSRVPTAPAAKGKVYLTGQVRTPGPQELEPGEASTVGKIILKAGGLADFADMRKVRIVRKSSSGGEGQSITVDLKEVLERGRVDQDVEVRDGDLIIVPQRLVNW